MILTVWGRTPSSVRRAQLGRLCSTRSQHGADIQDLMDAIRELMSPEEPNRRRMGFEVPSDSSGKTLRARAVPIRRNK